MPLPASRLIGHKEYGNTPPGGWAGRKQDPQYDMDWRRKRVAAFKPRTAAPTPPEDDVTQDDIKAIAAEVIAELRKADLSADAGGAQTLPNLLWQAHQAVTKDMQSLAVPDLKPADPRQFLLWIDRHVYQLNRLKAPYAIRLLEALCAKAGIDVAPLRDQPAEPDNSPAA